MQLVTAPWIFSIWQSVACHQSYPPPATGSLGTGLAFRVGGLRIEWSVSLFAASIFSEYRLWDADNVTSNRLLCAKACRDLLVSLKVCWNMC